jgi:MFS family permease
VRTVTQSDRRTLMRFLQAQFATSLLWSSAAQKHGRRAVLFVSLLGNALTLVLFGYSSSLGMAFCARAGQGLFNGAVGVARGAVRDLTDPTNEGRACGLAFASLATSQSHSAQTPFSAFAGASAVSSVPSSAASLSIRCVLLVHRKPALET